MRWFQEPFKITKSSLLLSPIAILLFFHSTQLYAGSALSAIFLTAVIADLGLVRNQTFQAIVHAATLTGLIIGVGALLLAILGESSSQKELDRLVTIDQQISTRLVGSFPLQVKPTAEFLGSTRRELDVVNDFASYGDYSVPQDFAVYLERLKGLQFVQDGSQQVQVNLLIYGREKAERRLKEQFRENSFEVQKLKSFGGYFENQHQNLLGSCPSWREFYSNIKWKDFIQFLLVTENEVQNDLRKMRNIHIKLSEEELGFFLFIRDNQDAIFTLQNSDPTTHAFSTISFKTSDPALVKTFQTTFEERWKSAGPLPTKNDLSIPDVCAR